MNPIQSDAFSFDWTYPAAFCWGLMVIASFAGWGRIVNNWLLPEGNKEDLVWPLASALGMTSFLVLSGPMLMLSLFSTLFTALFLMTGLILLALQVTRGRKQVLRAPPTLNLKIIFGIICAFTLLTYAGAVAEHQYNGCDDFAAYFAFTKMALDTGTLYDPFNFRLIGSVGGQPILTALVIPFLSWKYVHVLDMAICELIMLGLTMQLIRGNDVKTWRMRLLLVALTLTFSVTRNNSASELSTVVLFMALFHIANLMATRYCKDWKAGVLFGGLITGISTLRCHNIFVITAIGISLALWRFSESDQDKHGLVRKALWTLIMSIVLLMPWYEVTYRSSGAFLYPLFKGNHRPDFSIYNLHLSLWNTIVFVVNFFVSTGYGIFFLPICFLSAGRQRRALLFIAMAIFFISALAISQLTHLLYYDTYRYLSPIGLAFGLFISGIVAQQYVETTGEKPERFSKFGAIIFVTSLISILILQSPNFVITSFKNLRQIMWAADVRHPMTDYYVKFTSIDRAPLEYKEAFAKIPEGNKVLIALDYPFLLDYQKHTILSIDTPGAVSPSPGLPYFQGPSAVKDYLISHNIHYIANVPFDRTVFMHSIKGQQDKLAHYILMYKIFATFELDFMKNVNELAISNHILYQSSTIRVIALEDIK